MGKIMTSTDKFIDRMNREKAEKRQQFSKQVAIYFTITALTIMYAVILYTNIYTILSLDNLAIKLLNAVSIAYVTMMYLYSMLYSNKKA